MSLRRWRLPVLALSLLAAGLYATLLLRGGAPSISGQAAVKPASASRGRSSAQPERVAAVREAILWAWDGYARHAWGHDELKPVSRTTQDAFCNTGATIVDALSTLWLAGLRPQFDAAAEWALAHDFSRLDDTCSVFETNIRILGGLLSAGYLSGDARFFAQASAVGEGLLRAFETPTGIPCRLVGMGSGCGDANVAEAGTFLVEFISLSNATGDERFQKAAERMHRSIARGRAERAANGEPPACLPGLYPPSVSTRDGLPSSDCRYSFGAGGDSFYEYLLKAWLLVDKDASFAPYRRMWELSMSSALRDDGIVKCSDLGQLYVTFSSGFEGREDVGEMEHLACFVGGMLALGAPQRWGTEAAGLTHSCAAMYDTQSGLGAESVTFAGRAPASRCAAAPAKHTAARVRTIHNSHNYQRPEMVESLFILWRLTRDVAYRDAAWSVVLALNATRIATGGFASVEDVDVPPSRLQFNDLQQSFFLAEELKYLFLIFSDDAALDLDRWLFNTEAHPLPIGRPRFASSIGDVCEGPGAEAVCAAAE